MNAARKHQRPSRLPRRGEGEKLHQSRRQDRRLAVGAEPHHPWTRRAARDSAVDAHHPQRRPDRGGRAPAAQRRPRFDEIDAELAALSELREKPAGAIRITAAEHPAETILWPALAKLLPDYPDIKVEIVIDNGLTNIVAERFDAGVRLG